MFRPIGGFSLIAKRKLADYPGIKNIVKQVYETIKLGGEQADYKKHEYEYASTWGRELKPYPKRKLVDMGGLNNLIQHIVSLVPTPITILKYEVDLAIPIPSISLATAEDHSGGAFTATPSLTIPTPSVSQITALSWVLVEDCLEDAWDEYVAANVNSTTGAGVAKLEVGVDAAVGRLATEARASINLSGYNYLRAWVVSDINLNAGDLDIMLDDTAACISPLEQLDIPALTADTWAQITIPFVTPANLTAIISIGIDMNTDKGAFNFWIAYVRATEGGA